MAAPPKLPGIQGDATRDFSGGPNLRDAAPELAANELADAYNVTFDERGGVSSRLGYAKYNSSVFSGLVQNIYVSAVAAGVITQAGANLYKDTSTTIRKTFSTSARVGMVDFAGKLYVIHPVDGLWSSNDGITYTVVADVDAPDGDVLEVWQNKLFAAGNPVNKARVSWSAAGDGLTWSATDFNDLRTKDEEKVVALRVVPGLDVLGRSGLAALKQESAYRIYDPTTGAYETLDATNGAASALAVTSIGADLLVLNKHGIFKWRNGQVGLSDASDRLRPLWDPGQINLTKLDLFAAGRARNRAVFSLCRAGSTANDLAFEYHPEQGWLAPQSNAMSCYATSAGQSETTYGGSPTVSGQAYLLNQTGADDGAAIAWRAQTRWFEPNGGFQAMVWQSRLHGRGAGTISIMRDFATISGDEQLFDLEQDLPTYDSGLLYDNGEHYAEPASQATDAVLTIGRCRQFSLKFSGSSTTTTSGQQILGSGNAPQVGAFALFGLEWLYVPLGLS